MKYFELQKKIGWSNTQAASFFKVSLTTIKTWRNGKHKAPHAVMLVCESIINNKAVTISE